MYVLCYNYFLLAIENIICLVSLMDKTMDSGSINAGSIPARDAR